MRKATYPLHKQTAMQLLSNRIGPTIRIGREMHSVPYARFFLKQIVASHTKVSKKVLKFLFVILVVRYNRHQ